MKERLTRILKKERAATLPIWMPLTAIYTLAGNLLESGVIAPPVNPGDSVWFVLEEDGKWGVYEDVVTEAGSQWFFCPAVTGDMNNTDNRVGYDEIGTEVFLSKEEAEAACKERSSHVKRNKGNM